MTVRPKRTPGQRIHSRLFQEVSNGRAVVDMCSFLAPFFSLAADRTRENQHNSRAEMGLGSARPAAACVLIEYIHTVMCPLASRTAGGGHSGRPITMSEARYHRHAILSERLHILARVRRSPGFSIRWQLLGCQLQPISYTSILYTSNFALKPRISTFTY